MDAGQYNTTHYYFSISATYESVFSTHKLVSSDIHGLLGCGVDIKGS